MSKTVRPQKTDKIDNIVGMLMEYEKMTIDLMKKASDTPVLDQYDLNAPYARPGSSRKMARSSIR